MRREAERKRLADYNYALEWYGEDYAERHYGS
jgi:hypothetical protein